MNDKACFWIFKKNTLWAQVKPAEVLSSLGLKEGRDSFRKYDQSLVMPLWVRSPHVRLLKDFQLRWPNIKLKYEKTYSSNPQNDPDRIRTLIRGGKQVAYLLIPLKTLEHYERLLWHLERLHGYLEKVETLSAMPVDFYLDKMTSQGFTLHIEAIHKKTSDSSLNWMKNRMARHGFQFSFTNHLDTPSFPEDYAGAATFNRIELTDELLLAGKVTVKAFLGHEIQHSTNYVRRTKYGDASRQIQFFAGEANTKGLLEISREDGPYQRNFQTDEYEAWRITEKFDPEEYAVASKDFLENQIRWLQQLSKELPLQLVRSEVEFNWYIEGERIHHVSSVEKTQRNFFKFHLNPGTENEVFVLVPRVVERIQPRGNLRFLREVLGTRLRQLENHAKVRQTQEAQKLRAAEEAGQELAPITN